MHATLRLNSHRGRTSSRWQEYRSIRGAGDGGVGLRRRGRRRDRAGGGRVGATVRMATDLYEASSLFHFRGMLKGPSGDRVCVIHPKKEAIR